jgi:hypothetical protein
MIAMLRKMQNNINPNMSLKNLNRTSIYMESLQELVEFITKKLEAE